LCPHLQRTGPAGLTSLNPFPNLLWFSAQDRPWPSEPIPSGEGTSSRIRKGSRYQERNQSFATSSASMRVD